MLYEPTYEFHLLREETYPTEIQSVEQVMQTYAVKDRFTLKNGLSLAYSYVLAKDAIGSVILLHGFTEYYPKYLETAWYFLNQGYHVFTYDQRGHGYSDREVDNPSLVYIHSYQDYESDLCEWMEGVVEAVAPGLPIHLFGHSMGGSIALLYMQNHPNRIAKAILTSPMIVPQTQHVPRPIVRCMLKNAIRKYGEKSRFRFAGDFNPKAKYERSHDRSFERFLRNLNLRIQDEHYQNSASTNGWMLATMDVSKQLLNHAANADVQTQVLVLSGGKDNLVKIRYHQKVANTLPHSKRILFPDARHSIYSANDEQLETYYRLLLEFLKQ